MAALHQLVLDYFAITAFCILIFTKTKTKHGYYYNIDSVLVQCVETRGSKTGQNDIIMTASIQMSRYFCVGLIAEIIETFSFLEAQKQSREQAWEVEDHTPWIV